MCHTLYSWYHSIHRHRRSESNNQSSQNTNDHTDTICQSKHRIETITQIILFSFIIIWFLFSLRSEHNNNIWMVEVVCAMRTKQRTLFSSNVRFQIHTENYSGRLWCWRLYLEKLHAIFSYKIQKKRQTKQYYRTNCVLFSERLPLHESIFFLSFVRSFVVSVSFAHLHNHYFASTHTHTHFVCRYRESYNSVYCCCCILYFVSRHSALTIFYCTLRFYRNLVSRCVRLHSAIDTHSLCQISFSFSLFVFQLAGWLLFFFSAVCKNSLAWSCELNRSKPISRIAFNFRVHFFRYLVIVIYECVYASISPTAFLNVIFDDRHPTETVIDYYFSNVYFSVVVDFFFLLVC